MMEGTKESSLEETVLEPTEPQDNQEIENEAGITED